LAIILGEKITPTQIKILKFLLIARGGTVSQLVDYLKYETKSKPENLKKNLYRFIRELIEDNKLVIDTGAGFGKEIYIHLAPKGLEFMYYYLDIQDGYYGKGFSGDIGHFSYDYYMPPKSHIAHYMLQVDVFNVIHSLKRHYKGDFDFRDNRYTTVSYTATGIRNGKEISYKTKFRPDGEVIIGDDIYTIEIDTGSERGIHLEKKFEGYKTYFEHLEKNNQPLPRGIIFVTQSDKIASKARQTYGLLKRWKNLNKQFKKILGRFSLLVNLIYVPKDRTEYQFKTLLKNSGFQMTAVNCLSSSLKNIGSYTFKSKIGHPFEPFYLFSEQNGKKNLYIFSRAEGSESLGWYQLMDEYERFTKSDSNYEKVTPIIYYSTYEPSDPAPGELRTLKTNERMFYNAVKFYKFDEGQGIWFDSDRNLLKNIPLISTQ
jgi:hypothetical protein